MFKPRLHAPALLASAMVIAAVGCKKSDKAAVDTTDTYVRANPWRAVGISAAVGALIGFLAARR